MSKLTVELINKLAAQQDDLTTHQKAVKYITDRVNPVGLGATAAGLGTLGGGVWRGLAKGKQIGFARAALEGAGAGLISGSATGGAIAYAHKKLRDQLPEQYRNR